ncbi:MAG: sigma-70 family RNA polymerase sigma factor [Actinomycetota bacterium]
MAIRVSELRNGAAKAAAATYADLDDRMLVLDFQAGNAEVFGEIHRRYAGLARHVCQRILGNADDADEATQEAMLRIYQGLPRFNGRYALQPWVARIATNVSLDVTRARMRRPQTGDRTVLDLHEELRERSDDPLEALERGLERERVNEVLAMIPEHHREALILREFDGRSHREIGERLGVTPSQAKALIHRAKGSFRRAWENGKQRGLAVLAPVFLAPLRVPQLFRRLVLPTQELAASATAAPAASTSVVTTGERVTAAAVAVLITGTAAVGAVTIKQPPPKPKPVASPSAQVTVPATRLEPTLVASRLSRDRQKDKDHKAKLIPPVSASPSEARAPSKTPWPSSTESSSPSESPTPPPPPSLTMGFQVAAPGYACGCGPMNLVSEKVYGEAGKGVTFKQTAEGAAPDASGAEAGWSVKVGLFGSARDSIGTGGFWLYLYQADRYYEYEALGQLTSVEELESGGHRYTYAGSYHLITTPDADEKLVLRGGTFALIVDFWGDGTTVYHANVSLQEFEA